MRNERQDARREKFIWAIILASCLPLLASGSAHAANILITPDACAVAATPAPDVEYKPGTDAGGKAVAPADLPGTNTMPWPQDIQIPLQLNLQNTLHLPNNSNLVAPQAVVGTVEYKNGQLTFNGQPISDDARADIQAACQQSRGAEGQKGGRTKNLLRGD